MAFSEFRFRLLKQEKTAHVDIPTKCLKAGWDESYLLQVLSG